MAVDSSYFVLSSVSSVSVVLAISSGMFGAGGKLGAGVVETMMIAEALQETQPKGQTWKYVSENYL